MSDKKYYPIIGLEIHVQLNTVTKLFCNCLNEYAPDSPNKNICPFCTGQAGALPVLNKEAVKKAILLGQSIQAKIPTKTRFDRKNYFYPDLPSGYQISQYDNPIVEGGLIELYIEDKETGSYTESKVEITRAHLECDAAKLLHLGGKTMVDFNRSCAPLVEIVTEPCITSSGQAMAFVNELQLLVRTLGISDGDMEKGQMRFDCNLSLRNEEEYSNNKLPSYRTETKNINSVRSLGRAIEYEIIRQTALLESGIRPIQETRGWKDDQNKSISQRSKEEAMDYRYFPDPDLQILEISLDDLVDISELPIIPHKKRKALIQKGLSIQIANTINDNLGLSQYFEALNDDSNTKTLANILTGPITSKLKNSNNKIEEIYSLKQVLDLVNLVQLGQISNQNINKILDLVYDTEIDILSIVQDNNLIIINDTEFLEAIVKTVLEANTGIVKEYKAGKVQLIGFLIGQCMKQAKGQGNAQVFGNIIKSKLD